MSNTCPNEAHTFGQTAESIAAAYLRKKGFCIVAKNFRYKRFEIDLIVQKGELLVFIEVKARTNNRFGNPETFVTKKQIRAIRRAAEHYIRICNHTKAIRFDIVSVLGNGHDPKSVEILHLEDGFY